MSSLQRCLAHLALAVLVAAVPLETRAAGPRDPAAPVEFFEKNVRPILVNHCYTCHSAATKPSGGLRVDDRHGLLSGGNTGPAVVPGKPDESLLLRRVTHKDAKRRMPAEGQPLSEAQVAVLTKWIKDGAAWPAIRVPAALGKPNQTYVKLRKEHWAWQPLREPKVPDVRNGDWPRDAIDRFVLARLEAKGLPPVADADRLALLRRITFDLTGLPPTPEEAEAFLRSSRPRAVEELIDRLLASPQFGERWGRHWLDVARYGESTGPSRNIPYPHAWRYREYVIDSLNADLPFDRFLQEQIAGDLLPARTPQERDRLLTATGFLALGVKDVNQRFKVRFVMDNVDEQIDVVTRSVLGLTVSCARCHDHKFDPVPTTDYYALAGIFTSTDNCAGVRNKMGGGGLDYFDPAMLVRLSTGLPPPPEDQVSKLKESVAKAKAEWDAIRGTKEGLAKGPNGQPKQRPIRLKYERLQAELDALNAPAARSNPIHGVRDSRTIGDTEVRLRGQAEKLGPLVPRGFLSAFEVPGTASVNPKQSGRLELAQWLISPQNPLTARVIVNRVWQRLFGQGIVSTVDNFGTTGDTPSHPELLDYLAARFLRDGWSVKKLVRTLVLTRVYQLSAASSAEQRSLDPANRLLWRHTPRRLDAEELRDTMLTSAGTLLLRRGESSPARELKMVEMRDNGPEARGIHEQADRSRSRSVYLPLIRGLTPHGLEAFDPVDQTLVTGRRDSTTVPSQALFLLNSSFVRRQSLILAERLLKQKEPTDAERIRRAYWLTLSRPPNSREIEQAQTFLDDYESAYREHLRTAPPENPNLVKPVKPNPRPANPDEADQSGEPILEDRIRPADARSAAWLGFVQALHASAEFRYLK